MDFLGDSRFRPNGEWQGEDLAFDILDGLGCRTPARAYVEGPDTLGDEDAWRGLPGDTVILKGIAPGLVHKSDVGAVIGVEKTKSSLSEAMRAMQARVGSDTPLRYGVYERIEHSEAPGHAFLMGLRWTPEFGPVLALGMGGVYSELWAGALREGMGLSLFLLPLERNEALITKLGQHMGARLALRGYRGVSPCLSAEALLSAMERFAQLGAAMPDTLSECEVNPWVVRNGELIALDVRIKSALSASTPSAPTITNTNTKINTNTNTKKLFSLLHPTSIAIAGVSERINPGHIILNHLLEDGFDRGHIYIIKPGAEEIQGCRTVPDVGALPERVDVLVAGISAVQTQTLLQACVDGNKARCVVLISAGLEEKQGGQELAQQLVNILETARAEGKEVPSVLGGNCLGHRSLPARCDTIFIPRFKLPTDGSSRNTLSSMALVSQSGAFAIARLSKRQILNPRYLITLGNQMDIGTGDVLVELAQDPAVQTIGVYAEGFRDGDGARFLAAARNMVDGGRTVILYRGGRNARGSKAAMSHTARMAGDMRICSALAKDAGILVCDSLEDFEDLCGLFWCLENRKVEGRKLGVVSNAGFECVAVADWAGGLELAEFKAETASCLSEILKRSHLDSIADIHNPLDVTPMCGDAGYEACARAVLEDGGVDIGIMGIVPLTPALSTLPEGPSHAEKQEAPNSVVTRMIGLWEQSEKAWVAIVDSGRLYDAMADRLTGAGIFVFRHADRAARLLDIYVNERLRLLALRKA